MTDSAANVTATITPVINHTYEIVRGDKKRLYVHEMTADKSSDFVGESGNGYHRPIARRFQN